MDEIIDEVKRLREDLIYYIEPYGVPIETFEDAGARGIFEIHEQGVPRGESKFADELVKVIEFMPTEAVRAICLGAAYLMAGLGAHKNGMPYATYLLLSGASEIGFVRGIAFGVIHESDFNRSLMAARARKRHVNDPKQAAKQQVKECWDAWQSKPNQYKSKSAFARDMLEKFPHEEGGEVGLESQRVIERWCKEWESELSK
jgi:hypothetical protein